MDVILLYRQGRLSNDQSFLVQWVQNCQIAASVSARWACDHIESSYRQRRLGEEHFENKACVVFIDWSSCNFGGRHPWFRCPMPNCGRRAAILYFGTELVSLQTMLTAHLPHPAGSGLFRAQAVRKKLGGTINLSLPLPGKPRGMHWETYFRVCQKHDEWEGRSWPRWLINRAAHD